MATQTLLTYEQYLELPEQEGVFRELDEGRVIEMPRASFVHGALQGQVFHLLRTWVDQTSAEFVLSQNTGFLLAPDIERAPDVCALRRSSHAAMERVRGGALRGCPELAVEVVSESDAASDIDRKTEQYLRAGAAAVWILYPETRHVLVRRQSGETRLFGAGETIEEPDLFPGPRIAVNQIFNV